MTTIAIRGVLRSRFLGNPLFSQLVVSPQDDGNQPIMYFVLPPGKSKTEIKKTNLGHTFQACRVSDLRVKWIKDEDCAEVALYGDGNILVFDPFESPGFNTWKNKLGTSSSRIEILGPQVLRYIFNSPTALNVETKSVPTYTLAMRKMVVTLSGFDTNTKEDLEKIIRWMNGTVSPSLNKAVTHVVTANAITKKCLEANKGEIPVKTETWIREVWDDNQVRPVHATDPRYLKHLCPVFYNVTICSSQISAEWNDTLKDVIESLGGKYSSKLEKGVDVLVVMNAEGEKFRLAQKWNIPCVTLEWVKNSTKKEHLLPIDDFKVNSQTVPHTYEMMSTPAHSHVPDLDITKCSIIEPETTKAITNATTDTTRAQNDSHEDVIFQLTGVRDYLDGCKIYVVDYEKCEELKKVLNVSGAVRLNDLCNGVTHVIVTSPKLPKAVEEKLKELESMPLLVTIEWVVESAKGGYPVDEDLYLYKSENQRFTTAASVDRNNNCTPPKAGPSSNANPRFPKSGNNGSTTVSSKSSKSDGSSNSDTNQLNEMGGNDRSSYNPTLGDKPSQGIFSEYTFKVVAHDVKERRHMEKLIIQNSGTVTDEYPQVAILPSICNSKDNKEADKVFTKHWLFDCLDENTVDIPILLHHSPIPCSERESGILKNCVFAVSEYSQAEKSFIIDLIKAMGGRFQEVFVNADAKDKGTLRATHLISKFLGTDKANAAERWGVPIVVGEWVAQCLNKRQRLDEEPYKPDKNAPETTVFMPTPPETQPGATGIIKRKAKTHETDPEKPMEASDDHAMRSPIALTPVAGTSNSCQTGYGTSASNNPSRGVLNNIDGFGSLPQIPSQEEIDRKMAELKAMDPYSDESFQRLMDDIKARNINLDDISPFTSFEDRRLCNPDPDSPILLGLPRPESRALKEQFEVALQNTPIVNKIRLRPPTSTPMSEIVRQMNAIAAQQEANRTPYSSPSTPSMFDSPRITSTPKSGGPQSLIKAAAINRLSHCSSNSSTSQSALEADGTTSPMGIKKLGPSFPQR